MTTRRHNALEPATSFAGACLEPVRSAASSEQQSEQTWLLPSTSPIGDLCWLPTERIDDGPSLLEGLLTQRPAVGEASLRATATPWAEAKLKIVDELWLARNEYWERMRIVRQKWVDAGEKVTPDIAKEISAARDAVRVQVRARFVAAGRMAKAYDPVRESWRALMGKPSASRRVELKLEQALASGSAEELRAVIDGAFRSNKVVDGAVVVAKSGRAVLKVLGVGATVAMVVEVPYSLYLLDTARTDGEREAALRMFANASVAATATALCLVLGIGTGGVGFLACGVAPVLGGLYAGDGVSWVRSQLR